MSHVTAGGDIYRLPNKKGPPGHPARPKYNLYEQNGDGGGGGGGGGGVATRYMATGPTGTTERSAPINQTLMRMMKCLR
jgi:hypothetical protein